jgi:glycosyl transferase family 1
MTGGLVEASAIWLQPGDHPVFRRYAEFFGRLFRRFEALDYRAAYLDGGQGGVQQRVRAALERLSAEVLVYTQFPNSFAYLTPQFIGSLGSRTAVVGLGFDDEIYFDQAKFFYQACSAVITSDIDGARWLRQAGIPAYVAQLQQPRLTENMPAPRPEDIAVSFVGDMSKPGRRDYLRHLEAHGIVVRDYGAGSRNGRISDAEVLEVFRRSKINLNFTATNPPPWIVRRDPMRARATQIKGRPFELAAMGRFCLCEWAPCVEHWFQPGVDIGVFRGADDLLGQVQKYLNDDGLRRRVCASANERYRAELAPEIQFTRVFSEILACRDRPAVGAALGLGDPFFYESMGRSRGAAFLHALRRGSLLRAWCEVSMRWSWSLSYWRGFLGGLKDSLATGLRRT